MNNYSLQENWDWFRRNYLHIYKVQNYSDEFEMVLLRENFQELSAPDIAELIGLTDMRCTMEYCYLFTIDVPVFDGNWPVATLDRIELFHNQLSELSTGAMSTPSNS